jgi:phage shock protein PspC (stress-responsive transcriptional regulator)
MSLETYRPPQRRSGRQRLQRNIHRRRIGGVCAGLADYTGWDVTLIRFLFVLSMFFGGLGLGIYLALWLALPAMQEMPMPRVSWTLQRELRRIEKKVSRIIRKHDPAVADLALETFEALKLVAPAFEPDSPHPADSAMRRLGLESLPKLFDQLLAMPAQHLDSQRSAVGQALLEQLEDYRQQLQAAARQELERDFLASMGAAAGPDSPELTAWRNALQPLRTRLSERSGEITLNLLAGIEEKLVFLMQRLDQQPQDMLDLRPFEVRKIAHDYLPDTLNEYLRLPSGLARTERIRGEKTAEEALTEQLTLLDTTLHDLARSLFEKDAAGLLVHGRFLKEKFAEQPFRLDVDTPPGGHQ